MAMERPSPPERITTRGKDKGRGKAKSRRSKYVTGALFVGFLLPVCLSILFNREGCYRIVQDGVAAVGQALGAPVTEETHEEASQLELDDLGLWGESAKETTSNTVRVLLPEFLEDVFQKVYKEKLQGPLHRIYDKTAEFHVVSMDAWLQHIKDDVKKLSASRYDMYAMVSTWIPTFVEQEALMDLSELMTDLGPHYWEDIMPQVRENVAIYENKVYALPADGDVVLMLYNNRILEEHGLDPPNTWHEWIEISKKLYGIDLNGDGVPDGGSCVVTEPNGFWAPLFFAFAAPFLQRFGSDEGIFFNPNNMKPKFRDPAYAYVLDLYKEMVQYSPYSLTGELSSNDAHAMFLNGSCALYYNFHGFLRPLIPELSSSGIDYKLAVTPGTKLVVSADGKQIEECTPQNCPYADDDGVNRAPFYGEGGIGLVVNAHARPEVRRAAASFAISMTGPETSLEIVTAPGSLLEPYRYSHFEDVEDPKSETSLIYQQHGWSHNSVLQWKNCTIQAWEHLNGVRDLSIYGKAEYTSTYGFEAILREFLKLDISSSDILMQLSNAWETLTNRYGKSIQLHLYRKNLGLPTSKEGMPAIATFVAIVAILGLVVLVYYNRKLSKELTVKRMESKMRMSTWNSLVSNEPATRLMSVLKKISKGKKPDPNEVLALLVRLQHRGEDLWKPDLHSSDFAQAALDNKAFADYLKFNLGLSKNKGHPESNTFPSTSSLGQPCGPRRGSSLDCSTPSGTPSGTPSTASLSKSKSKSGSLVAPLEKEGKGADTFGGSTRVFSRHGTVKKTPDGKDVADPISDLSLSQWFVTKEHERVSTKDIVTVESIGDWNHDPFQTNSISNKHPILTVMYNIFQQSTSLGGVEAKHLLKGLRINEEKLWNYVQVIEAGMDENNVYHNQVHVCDVLHTMYWMLTEGALADSMCLTQLEVFCALFAAMIHDFDHLGVTNEFLVRTGHPRAVMYNNKSVNENWHAAMAFYTLNYGDSDVRWDEDWTEDEIFEFRSLATSMVLATDMSRHFELLGRFKAKMAGGFVAGNNPHVHTDDTNDRWCILHIAIKACDISSQAKEWKLARKWADWVQEEFFLQGDREKELGLTPTPLCDRFEVNMAKSQVGFVDAVLFPLFEPLEKLIPAFSSVLAQLEYNRSMWQKEAEEEARCCSEIDCSLPTDVVMPKKG